MAADQQFLDALKYLGGSIQQYGISQAIDTANEQAQTIRSTMDDELQQRQALRNLAQFSTLNAAGAGASQLQTQALEQSIMPIMPTSAEQAVLQGQATGDSFLAKIGTDAIKAQQQRELDKVKAQAETSFKLQSMRDASAEKTANSKLDAMSLKQDQTVKTQILKENRSLYQKMQGSSTAIDSQIAKINNAQKLLEDSRASGTGPFDQYTAGATEHGQKLKQALSEISLDKMVSMFAGMSKAVDSEGERKFFQSTQPSMGQYESVNKEILNKLKENALSLKTKTDNALQAYKRTGGISFEVDPQDTMTTSPLTTPVSGLPSGTKSAPFMKKRQ